MLRSITGIINNAVGIERVSVYASFYNRYNYNTVCIERVSVYASFYNRYN